MKYTLYNKTTFTIECVIGAPNYSDIPYKDYYILDNDDINNYMPTIHTYVQSAPFIEKQRILVGTIVNDLISAKRNMIERNGVFYTFPDSITDTIQTRYENDFRNLNSLMSVAMLYLTQSITTPIKFRCESNNDYTLSPSEIIQMCSYVIGYVSLLYEKSWIKKQELIPLSYAQLLTYDINADWV